MLRFAVTFLVLLVALFAIELTPPGKAYFVDPWTNLVARASAGLMAWMDPGVIAQGATVASTKTGFAVTILAGCNGVEAMLVLVAGVLAYPAPWRHRLIGLAIGIVAIQALNLLRIVSLFYLGQWDRQWFEWAHLYLWQALIMLDAVVVWLLWIRAVPAPAPARA